ncbi:MAG: hypothetical protein ACAH80_16070 [Alphaproteobacteria bacterium]
MADNKEDAYRELLERLRPDIARICDSLKAALQSEPAPEPTGKKGLRESAKESFARSRRLFDDESGSMKGPPLTAKQQIEMLTILVGAAHKVGLEVKFPTADELKAEGRWDGPNVTPFKPKS